MRARLPHPLRERPLGRGVRRAHERKSAARRNEPRHASAEPAAGPVAAGRRDVAVERARSAGGPLDTAVYTCGCGYLFSAPVSTSVACPHCGSAQAW